MNIPIWRFVVVGSSVVISKHAWERFYYDWKDNHYNRYFLILPSHNFERKVNFCIRALYRSATYKLAKLSKAKLLGPLNWLDAVPDEPVHPTIQWKPFASDPMIWLPPLCAIKRYLFPSSMTVVGSLSVIVRFTEVLPATVIPFN